MNFKMWKPIIMAVNAILALHEFKWEMILGPGGTQRLIRNVSKCITFEMG
jgi:enoyl-CoA hydratase/carnithine racemase